ncbi:hypothetical protein PG275_07265 [Riemerella anatipestifer]|uniref:hypothetical protein n=1 Tax=Riemerella anatipestifer TaxID=34085 RepID=UPI002A85AFB6|nr:hypothetical protein [Riemerella anatipestifer]
MYNDPNGELFWFAALTPILGKFLAGVVAGAIGGAIIGDGLYLGRAAITGNFSWGGFAKAFFGGALTGAVSGALGQVFSTSSFWATVGNGALAGAGSGGVNAILNGTNFLEGIAKGAVIGGAVSAISYTINFLCNYKTEQLTEADLDLNGTEYLTPNPSSDPAILNERIKAVRENNYTASEIKRFGIKGEKVDISSINSSSGYIDGNIIAETRPNFFSNTSNITYSARAANNPYLLGKTMAHETAHAYANKLTRLIPFSGNQIKTGLSDGRLDTIEHIAIKKLENVYYNIKA